MTDCVFCPSNWDNLDIVERPLHEQEFGAGRWLIINPLNPVTEGHVLVICSEHSQDASEDVYLAGDLMLLAADYVRKQGIQANIITSIGPDATQSVFHTHVHIVPRTPDDGLCLPWSFQDKAWLQRQYLRAQGWRPFVDAEGNEGEDQ